MPVPRPTRPLLAALLVALLAGAWQGAAPHARADTACPDLHPRGEPPALLRPTLERGTRELCFAAFAVLHSAVSRTPLWAAERLTREGVAAARARERADTAFREEPRLPVRERAALADYARSGWDRGHMAPAGDMPTAAAEAESFTLANTVPQDPELNRGLWADVEAATRELAHREGEVFVLTGPLFEGGTLRQLNGRVLVPTGLWKAVWAPARGEAGAWVVANAADARPREVALAELDGLAGVAAFPALPPAVRAAGMRLPEPLRHEPRHRDAGRADGGGGGGRTAPTLDPRGEPVALALLLGLGAVAVGGGVLTWRAVGRRGGG